MVQGITFLEKQPETELVCIDSCSIDSTQTSADGQVGTSGSRRGMQRMGHDSLRPTGGLTSQGVPGSTMNQQESITSISLPRSSQI